MSDIHALSGAYAVDAVDDVERLSFERHLATCETCRAEVADLRATAAALADDAATMPPPELRAAVLDGISRVRPLPPEVVVPGGPARSRRWFPALVAAVVLAIVGVGATVWHPWQHETSSTLSATERVLHASDAVSLTASLPGGGAATIVRSASQHRAVMITKGVSAAPSGKVYQLWLQSPDQRMVSAGLMSDSTKPTLLSGDAATAIGAGLSLEPAGGSTQPTDVLATFDFGSA